MTKKTIYNTTLKLKPGGEKLVKKISNATNTSPNVNNDMFKKNAR